MEVGARHDGLCDPLSKDTTETGSGLSYSGQAHKVDIFSSRADDLHTGGILMVVYPRDRLATWSASIHSVE